MEIDHTSDRTQTLLALKYGWHSLVGNYFDCVGNCVDYLVNQKKVRRATILKDGLPLIQYIGKLMISRPYCKCFEFQNLGGKSPESKLHGEQQDIECNAWKRLLELVEVAAEDEREEFAPGCEMGQDDWHQIITLPATISKLKSVKHLMLYGSNLVRIPPEIGGMTNLEKFTPYTSYRLHWFPYEITYCKKLNDSTVSTRVLYGNYKFRPPFPKLPVEATVEAGSPTQCSICQALISASNLHQVWISLQVATDVLPLLVNACSKVCIDKLPRPPQNYVQKPHRGGLNIQQPSSHYKW